MSDIRSLIDLLLKETAIDDAPWLRLIALLEDSENLISQSNMWCGRGFFEVHLSTSDYDGESNPITGFYIGISPPHNDEFVFSTTGFTELSSIHRKNSWNTAIGFFHEILNRVIASKNNPDSVTKQCSQAESLQSRESAG